MNNDLISREALKNYARKVMYEKNATNFSLLKMFDEIIDHAPSVEEIAQGEWKEIQAGMLICPFCGARPHKVFKSFCANCGAKMKVGADMRNNKKETTFDDYLKKQLKDPEFRKEWEKLCEEDMVTNNDLVSREALKEAFEDLFYNDYDDQKRTERLIDNAPTVKPCENCDLYFKAMTKEEMKKGGAK